MKKIFEVHQKITLLVNEYQLLEDSSDGSQQTVGYVKQKRFALREQFSLFKDESQQEVVASSKAQSVIDLGAVYDIFNEKNMPIGAIKKDFKKSLIRSTWMVYGPNLDKLKYTMTEKSMLIAILRRLWELAPYASDVGFPIKYHFTIKNKAGKEVGEYIKITRFRDHYALYLDDKVDKTDNRVWMITAVLLDAMQSR